MVQNMAVLLIHSELIITLESKTCGYQPNHISSSSFFNVYYITMKISQYYPTKICIIIIIVSPSNKLTKFIVLLLFCGFAIDQIFNAAVHISFINIWPETVLQLSFFLIENHFIACDIIRLVAAKDINITNMRHCH